MDQLLSNIRFSINDKIYLKDPESSELGKRIVEHSILLIDSIGFDQFTFKKLSQVIGSTESSVYRYFENKHKLLLYLSSWYWGWMEYKLVFATHSITDARDKLQKALQIITAPIEEDRKFSHVNEVLLHRILVAEHSKSFLTKEVDKENKEGFFSIYKRLVHRIADMVQEINPAYPYAKSLVATILEGNLHQHFLTEHLPTITNCSDEKSVTDFFLKLVFQTIEYNHEA